MRECFQIVESYTCEKLCYSVTVLFCIYGPPSRFKNGPGMRSKMVEQKHDLPKIYNYVGLKFRNIGITNIYKYGTKVLISVVNILIKS